MPRNIIVPDELEARTREACAGYPDIGNDVLPEYLDLIDASHAAQRARAEQHAADNAALADLVDPCACGDHSKPGIWHTRTGRLCCGAFQFAESR